MCAYLKAKSTIIQATAASNKSAHSTSERQPCGTFAEKPTICRPKAVPNGGTCRVAPRDTTSLEERASEVICPNVIASVQQLIDRGSIDRFSVYAPHRGLGTIVLLRLSSAFTLSWRSDRRAH